jgi:small subunit ribosomal protein S6
MRQYYEFVGIIPGGLAETEVGPVMKEVADLFAAQNAEIAYQENLGRRKMAYPIKHLRHGYYFLIEFHLETAELMEIERRLKLNEQVLRYLIIKSSPKTREEREKQKTRQQSESDRRDKPKKTIQEKTTQEKTEEAKISLEELDKKLDEILEEKI